MTSLPSSENMANQVVRNEDEEDYHRYMEEQFHCYHQAKYKLSPVYQVCDYCGYGRRCPYGPYGQEDWPTDTWLKCQEENTLSYETDTDDN